MSEWEEDEYLNDKDDPFFEGCTCSEVPCWDTDCDCKECHG